MENKMSGIDPKDLVDNAQKHAQEFLKDGVKTHQLRNFFGTIEKMRRKYYDTLDFNSIRRDFILLKPKLAYAAGRQPNTVGKSFYQYMTAAINSVEGAPKDDKNNAVENYFAYIESVIAYHKFHDKVKNA